MLIESEWHFLHESRSIFVIRQHVPHVVQIVLSRFVLIRVLLYAKIKCCKRSNERNGAAEPEKSLCEQN